MKKLLFYLFFFGIISIQLFAQSTDEKIFAEKIKIPTGENKAETVINIAKSFIEKPYISATLEGNPKEQLVCNLREFDCFTFVENVVALTLIKSSKSPSYDKYQKILTDLRYRQGQINGYGSREHYLLDWIRQAEANGILENVTDKIGGEPIEKEINFMTKHRDLYPKLKDEQAYLAVMDAESNLNKVAFSYIPKTKVAKIENKIQEGDIIAITSGIDGLDFNHEGFAIRQNGRICLLHASLDFKKVITSKEPLADYLARIKKHSGIMVLRLK